MYHSFEITYMVEIFLHYMYFAIAFGLANMPMSCNGRKKLPNIY
jgi:hypothetical protein